MPSVPVPPEGGLRSAKLHAVAGGAVDAEAILRGAPAKNAYDPNKWYVTAYNEHDHTNQTRLNLHPDVARALTTALQNDVLKAVGIRSAHAFIRACVVDGLHKLYEQTLSDEMRSALQREVARAELDAIAARADEMDMTVTTFENIASKACARNDWRSLAAAVDMFELTVDELHDPYRQRGLDLLHYYASRVPTQS